MRRKPTILALMIVAEFSCRPAWCQAPGPVVAIKEFSGEHPEIKARGFSELMLRELLPRIQACRGKITEWTRREDVIKEVEFQQSEYVDKTSAAEPGHLLLPDYFVEGNVVGDGKSFTYSTTAKNAVTGEIIAQDSGTLPESMILEFTAIPATKLAKKICEEKAGFLISGQMDDGTIRGTICGGIEKPFTAISPEVGGKWQFTPTGPSAGSFSYTASNVGGVPGSGAGTYVISKASDGSRKIKLNGKGSIHSPLGTFSATIFESLTLTPIKTCGRQGRR